MPELARLYEQTTRLDLALRESVQLATSSADNEFAVLGLTRILRKLGRTHALALLTPLLNRPESSFAVRAELGHLELDAGAYEQAERCFQPPPGAYPRDPEALAAAAITAALRGQPRDAERLLDRVTAMTRHGMRRTISRCG